MATDKFGHDESGSRLFTLPQAARDLNCSIRTLWRLASRKQLDIVRLGRAVRITKASIDELIRCGGSK